MTSATERAFLREPPAPGPSRPRFTAGPRLRRQSDPAETRERQRVARVIREARLRTGASQVEAARALGVPATDLSAWERAKDPVPPGRRGQIAAHYGFDPALIAALDLREVAATPEERVMLARFRLATEDERRQALAVVCP